MFCLKCGGELNTGLVCLYCGCQHYINNANTTIDVWNVLFIIT